MDAEPIVRNFYAALARGDSGAAFALLSAEIEWTEAEHSPYYTGTVKGKDAVAATVFTPISRAFLDFACVPSDYISQADRTVSFGLYTGRARIGGGRLKASFVHVWTAASDCLIRFQQFTDTAAWIEAMKS